jgi:hypothetical protein
LAAHPQIRASQGTRVVLPESVRYLVPLESAGLLSLQRESIDVVSIASLVKGESKKYFLPPKTRIESVLLSHDEGSAMRFGWRSDV